MRLPYDREATMVIHVTLFSQRNQHHEMCIADMHQSAASYACFKLPAFMCVRECNADWYTVQKRLQIDCNN